MPTVISGLRSTGPTVTSAINQDRRIVDMAEKIALLEPSAAPLLRLLTPADDKKAVLRKRKAINSEFKWLEDELYPEWTAVATAATAAATSIVVDDNIFEAGDLVVNPKSGEVFSVTSKTTVTLTVVRGSGATALAVDDPLLIIGNAFEEGATAAVIRSTVTSTGYNYCQIFKTGVGVTKSLKASELYGSKNDLAYQRMKAGIDHAKKIEKSFLFGRRSQITTGTHTKRYTGGLLEYITTNIREVLDGNLTIGEFNGFCKTLFQYGSDKKIILCSGNTLQALNNLVLNKLTINEIATKKYGMNIAEWFTPFGTAYLVHHRMLTGAVYGGYSIGVDMDNVSYRFLAGNGENRDTHLETNIQANGTDTENDQYLSEVGIEVKLEKTHAVETGVDL